MKGIPSDGRSRASVPKKVGGSTVIGPFKVTKIRNYHFKLEHVTTKRQFLTWSNGMTHVWECDEVVMESGAPKRTSTDCISYQSLTHMCRDVLPKFVKRTEGHKEARAARLAKLAQRDAEEAIQQQLNRTVVLVEIPESDPQKAYRVVKETDTLIVYEGPGGKNDRYALKLRERDRGDFRDGWAIFKVGEIEPLAWGLADVEAAAAELGYFLYAPDFEYQWTVDPQITMHILERTDGTYIIREVLGSGLVRREEFCEDLPEMLRQFEINMSALARISPSQKQNGRFAVLGKGQGRGSSGVRTVSVASPNTLARLQQHAATLGMANSIGGWDVRPGEGE